MDEELELFKEDASEQLQYMENALVSANEEGIDDEKIGEIFRAMHTIKGTAGMFGFSSVVDFTHIAENLLDELRQHTVQTDEHMMDLFLKCKDHCEVLIEYAISEEDLTSEIMDNSTTLVDELLTYMPNNQTAIKQELIEKESNMSESGLTTTGTNIWHISIRFNEDFFTSGMDILSIFSFFNKMGEILINLPIINNIPPLNDLDPLKSTIGFEMEFQSTVGYEEIEEVFEFVMDDINLCIFVHDDLKKLEELLSAQTDESLKELFLAECIYTKDQLHIQDKVHTEEVSQTTNLEVKSDNTPQLDKDSNTVDDSANNISEVTIPTQKEETMQVSQDNQKEKSTTSKKKAQVQKSFSLRVDSAKIDHLITQISEMVIANAKITQIAMDRDDSDLEESVSVLTDMLEDVRNGIMNIRMVQVEESFVKFRRIVNDTAKKMGKEIDFVIVGGETELDKTVVEKISDPLVHMLRNSIDHGVEMPEDRIKKGKNPKGRVELKAFPDAGTIVIQISDDGAGLDKDKLYEKAVKNGIINEHDVLTEKQIFNLIFEAGLSTANQISDISGRGVGMDVVRRNIQDLRGQIDIESTLGKGTTFTIRLPLTLAIIDGFLVQAGDTKYVIPLENIQECIELNDSYKASMKGNDFINLRGEILPILDIKSYLNSDQKELEDQRENVVVVRYANKVIGLQVDELYGEHQTVIKPLGDIFENVEGVSGGSILGTGEVSLIFDIPKLIEHRAKQA
ncbi:MAG: chemotaxis protein CheA [Campylobacteraceae bacterium]|nr:chemotaxis protein CheA [Campylobacteraceae bacterium]